MIRAALLVWLSFLLAACGGLEAATGMPDPFGTPQPFQGTGDQQLVNEVLGERTIFVGPIAGLDADADASLRAAIAMNAAIFDVLASSTTIPKDALTLTGTAKPGAVDFILADGPTPLAQFTAGGEAAMLAAEAARALAQTLGRLGSAPPTVQAAAPAAPVAAPAAFVRAIAGPSRDKGEPLRRAIAQGLSDMGVRMQQEQTQDAYAIAGDLTLGADTDGKTLVSISWTVFAPDGRDLGKADQQNTLPSSAIRETWPEQAALAGGAAAASVVQIIANDFNAR
jgi:hypothetical protein